MWSFISKSMKIVEKEENDQHKFYRFFWIFLIHSFQLFSGFISNNHTEHESSIVQKHKCGVNDVDNHFNTNENSNSACDTLFEDSKEMILSFLKDNIKLLDTKFSEPNLKSLLMALIQISSLSRMNVDKNKDKRSVANIVVLSQLWDFFSKRLNNTYQGSTLTGLQMIPTSQESWKSHICEVVLAMNEKSKDRF